MYFVVLNYAPCDVCENSECKNSGPCEGNKYETHTFSTLNSALSFMKKCDASKVTITLYKGTKLIF